MEKNLNHQIQENSQFCKIDLVKTSKSTKTKKRAGSNKEDFITSFNMPISEKRCFVRRMSKFERQLTNLIEQVEHDKSKTFHT
jgi:hypothetical protein